MKPYNSFKFSIIFAVLSTALFAYSEPKSTETPKESVKEVATSELAKTGNEALRFMLDRAKSYTGKIEDGVAKAVDVAQQEAPETIRQFLVWRAWKHGLSYAIQLLLTLALGIVSYLGYKKSDWNSYSMTAGCVMTIVTLVFSVFCFAATLIATNQLLSLIQIWVAPRIYLIEEVTKLIR